MGRELTSSHAEVVLEGFLELETPEGFRAELIDDEIVLTPPPDGDHEDHLCLIVEQVINKAGVDMDFSGNKSLKVPRGGSYVRNHVIPDATFVLTELRLFRGAEPWMPCDGVSMVAEVTSTKPDRDRTAKLFSAPEGADYRQHVTVPFGKQLDLPAPFAFSLETTDFV